MKEYHRLVSKVLNEGVSVDDRTGVGTFEVFGSEVLNINLAKGFPLLTGKTVNFNAIVSELKWFLSGSTNINDLNSKIWDEWAKPDGSLGPIYGHQWRSWEGSIDQIKSLIQGLLNNPDDRGLMLSAWNVADLPLMALRPCHAFSQYKVINGHLCCSMYQRSADLFLGVPFNIASYALLTHLLAKRCGREIGTLSIHYGSLHIYKNHVSAIKEYMRNGYGQLPIIKIAVTNSELFSNLEGGWEANLIDYNPVGGVISAPIAV